MKKITCLSAIVFAFIFTTVSYAQKVAVVGMNHITNDGFTFVALEAIPSTTQIYFTHNAYNDAGNVFSNDGWTVLMFEATSPIAQGTVIYIKETSSESFTVSCCGTIEEITAAISGPFALATDGDELYAFGDTGGIGANPFTGVTEIYSVMYTGDGTTGTSGGPIPPNKNPIADYPNAIIIDGFPGPGSTDPVRIEYKFDSGERAISVNKADLENISNYLHAAGFQDLSTIPFTSIVLGANDFVFNNVSIKLYPNPTSNLINIDSSLQLDHITLYDVLGKEIMETAKTSQISIGHLPSGMYFLKLTKDQTSLVRKIVKQ